MKLNQAALPQLLPAIRRPRYDRTDLPQHTVHIGVGGFHRAHQAVYLDDLLHLESEPRWAECGFGVLPHDSRMRDALESQDYLYTVLEKDVEKDTEQQTARVIGSIGGFLLAPQDPEAAIEKLASPETKIVSLTITEGGYFLDEGTGRFDPDHPEIQQDLRNPENPRTSVGYIAAALNRRRLRGQAPFTVMSCDNLQVNGKVVQSVVLGFAAMRDAALETWIRDNVAFPNSMVDRITPATTDADRSALAAQFGIEDAWPVMTESFTQWVIEDHFCAGRPRWEKVGAQIVPDVAPYELMKIRLLNGSHLALAYLGALAGYTYVHEVMQQEIFVAFVRAFMDEVTPVVPTIPGVSVEDYKQVLIERFRNPGIHDQVTRLCSEGSAKIPKWLLPSIVELLEAGRPTKLLSLVIAGWIHYLRIGVDERGNPLDIVDARRAELQQTARSGGADPRAMLATRSIFGSVLPAHAGFVQAVEAAMRTLETRGAEPTMRTYLSTPGTSL